MPSPQVKAQTTPEMIRVAKEMLFHQVKCWDANNALDHLLEREGETDVSAWASCLVQVNTVEDVPDSLVEEMLQHLILED